MALTTGTSYAAAHVHLPKNSVTAKQVKNGSLTGADLKNGSVTGADLAAGSVSGATIADGSLTSADLSASSLSSIGRPRAYGSLDANGHLLSGAGVTAVPDLDGVCLTPVAGSTINPALDPIVAMTDDTTVSVVTTLARYADNVLVPGCTTGYFLHVSAWNGTTFTQGPLRMAFVIP